MNVLNLSFIAVELACAGYFVFRIRPFDLFALANFSAAFYMLPLMFGYLPLIAEAGVNPRGFIGLDPDMYVIGFSLILSTTAAAIVFDLFKNPRRSTQKQSLAIGFLVISLVGFSLHALTQPIFFANKAELLNHIGYPFVLFETAMALAVIDAFYNRRWYCLSIAMALLLLDIAIGFRFNAVVVGITIMFIWLSGLGPARLWSRLYIFAGGILVILFVALFANPVRLYGPVKAAEMMFLDREQQHDELYRIEPFVTQSIANEVLRNNFACPAYNWRQVAASILPLGKILGIKPHLFQDDYKALFPQIQFGMAGNPWAEAICRNGWMGFGFTLACFIALLLGLQFLIDRQPGTALPSIALCGVFVAFYFHRNDAYFLFLLLRRVALVAVSCYFLYYVTDAARRLLAARRTQQLKDS